MLRSLAVLLALFVFAPALEAQTNDLRRVVLEDGTVLVGYVDNENADPLVIRTESGVEQRVPRSQVVEVGPLIDGRFFRLDPTRTRLILTPTGRTLGGGRKRVGTLFYIIPQATIGLSDRFDVSGTLGLSFGSNFFSLTPVVGGKLGLVDTGSFALAAGANLGTAIGDNTGGAFVATPFAAATFGNEIRSVSASVTGLIGGSIETADVEAANGVLLGLGGEIQINNGVKLVLDSLIPIVEGDSGALVAPGVRFFGDQFSVDLFGGIGIAGDGFAAFAPIANFSYTF